MEDKECLRCHKPIEEHEFNLNPCEEHRMHFICFLAYDLDERIKRFEECAICSLIDCGDLEVESEGDVSDCLVCKAPVELEDFKKCEKHNAHKECLIKELIGMKECGVCVLKRGKEECMICLEDISEDAKSPLTCCAAKFHASCLITNWKSGNQTEDNNLKCPHCKKPFIKTLTSQFMNDEDFALIRNWIGDRLPEVNKFFRILKFGFLGGGFFLLALSVMAVAKAYEVSVRTTLSIFF